MEGAARPGGTRGRRFRGAALLLLVLILAAALRMIPERLLNTLLFFPSRGGGATPSDAGLAFEDVLIPTGDGERLHGWWIPALVASRERELNGHLILFPGNAGMIEGRLVHADQLVRRGFDVLLFDYRGYGRSTGAPSETGTYADARAALAMVRGRPGVDPSRVFYLGESLGGAVAVELATAAPPRGLVLQSTFQSVRAMASLHYGFVPARLVKDAYPSDRRIAVVQAPVLFLHGDRDDIVPLEQGQALFAAAREPKRMHVVPGAGHNDLLYRMGERYGRLIGDWAREVLGRAP